MFTLRSGFVCAMPTSHALTLCSRHMNAMSRVSCVAYVGLRVIFTPLNIAHKWATKRVHQFHVASYVPIIFIRALLTGATVTSRPCARGTINRLQADNKSVTTTRFGRLA